MAKILIVDDEEDIVSALSIRLKAAGYDVIFAYDGMEELDGYKVCRILKFDEKFKHIPIIMITAKFGEDNKKMGGCVGADAYILKPFDPKELMSKIEEVLVKKKEE